MSRKGKAKKNLNYNLSTSLTLGLLYTSLLLQLYFLGDIKINLGLIVTTKVLLSFLLTQKKNDNIHLASVR